MTKNNESKGSMYDPKGIYAGGYGYVPKCLMVDPSIPREAKALYAYFASFAGKNISCFPEIDTIYKELNISKDRFYTLRNILISRGYITVVHRTKENGCYFSNLYYLIPNSVIFSNELPEDQKCPAVTMIIEAITKEHGYGKVSQSVMRDPRIKIIAKSIYAYVACFAGRDSVAFPEQSILTYHLDMNTGTYQTHVRSLIQTGLITRIQRHENGKLSRNEYIINIHPVPTLKIDAYQTKKIVDNSFSEATGQDTVNSETADKETVIPETNIFLRFTSSNMTSQDINRTTSRSCDVDVNKSTVIKEEQAVFTENRYLDIREEVNEELCDDSRNILKHSYDIAWIKTAVRNMTDWRCSRVDYSRDPGISSAYMIFIDALSEMLLSSFRKKIDGEMVTNEVVLDHLGDYLSYQSDRFNGNIFLRLDKGIVDDILNRFCTSVALKTVSRPRDYMKGIIYRTLKEYKLTQNIDYYGIDDKTGMSVRDMHSYYVRPIA